jgi:uncharacterized protein
MTSAGNRAASKGRYVIRQNGEEAELTYSITSPTLIIADHTSVPDSLRGTGAGLALVARMVEDARNEGVRIMPLCPFVNATAQEAPRMGGCLRRLISCSPR